MIGGLGDVAFGGWGLTGTNKQKCEVVPSRARI